MALPAEKLSTPPVGGAPAQTAGPQLHLVRPPTAVQFQPASRGRRILGYLIDSMVGGLIGSVVVLFWGRAHPLDGPVQLSLHGLLHQGASVLTFILIPPLLGTSVGKMLLNMHLRRVDKRPLSLGANLARHLFIGIGSPALGLQLLISKSRRHWGDSIAKTEVVEEPNPLQMSIAIPVFVALGIFGAFFSYQVTKLYMSSSPVASIAEGVLEAGVPDKGPFEFVDMRFNFGGDRAVVLFIAGDGGLLGVRLEKPVIEWLPERDPIYSPGQKDVDRKVASKKANSFEGKASDVVFNDAMENLKNHLDEAGKIDEAYDAGDELLRRDKNDVRGHVLLSRSVIEYGHISGVDEYDRESLRKAESLLNDGVAINPKNEMIWETLCRLYAIRNEPTSYKEARAKLAALNPTNVEGTVLDGLHSYISKDYDGAKRILVPVAETNQDPYWMRRTYRILAETYIKTGEAEKADASFRKLIEIQPGKSWPLHNYSLFLTDQKRLTEALTLEEKAIALKEYPSAKQQMARLHYMIGAKLFWDDKKLEEGAEHFKKSIEFEPRYEDRAYFALSDFYSKEFHKNPTKENYEKANLYIDSYLKFRPNDSQGHTQKQWLLSVADKVPKE